MVGNWDGSRAWGVGLGRRSKRAGGMRTEQ